VNNSNAFLYGIGTVLVAAISVALIFGWAQNTMAATQEIADTTAFAEMTTVPADRLVRVVLASPYER
jgi:hypothetical protein